MTVDNAFHGGQTNTGSGKFLVAMQVLEDAKQSVAVSHVKPSSVVPNKIGHAAVALGRGAEFDVRDVPPGSELAGIARQVFQYLFQHSWITVGGDAFGNDKFHLAGGSA